MEGIPVEASVFKRKKEEIRRRIWLLMEKMNIARFPKPVYGRIPNFVNSEVAAQKLADQKEFKQAKVVKVNPDSPQSEIRYLTLLNGKTLIMPTPRLRSGFLILDPDKIPKSQYSKASSIHGAFKYGKPCGINEIPSIDLVVVGSVAVSRDGVRIGKGGGYSEIEYGMLREIGSVKEETPIFTTIHDVQIIDGAPREPYDLIVDAIVTPTRVIRIKRAYDLPKGIIWEKLSIEKIKEIPILAELRKITV